VTKPAALRTDPTDLRRTLIRQRRAVERLRGERTAAERAVATATEQIIVLEKEVQLAERAHALLSSFAETSQADLLAKIQGIVTYGLRVVFGEDMSFHMTSVKRGNTTATDLTIRSSIGGTVVETDILSARGGGVAAVAGVILRITMLLLTPSAPKFMALDEAFAQLSDDKISALIGFIKELVDRTDLQLIVVTHTAIDEWREAADKVYHLTNVNGVTKSRELTA
jgi:chromosome segregation ATPase